MKRTYGLIYPKCTRNWFQHQLMWRSPTTSSKRHWSMTYPCTITVFSRYSISMHLFLNVNRQWSFKHKAVILVTEKIEWNSLEKNNKSRLKLFSIFNRLLFLLRILCYREKSWFFSERRIWPQRSSLRRKRTVCSWIGTWLSVITSVLAYFNFTVTDQRRFHFFLTDICS